MTETALVPSGPAPNSAPGTVISLPASGMTEAQILTRLQTVADVLAPGQNLTAPELELFAMHCARTGLDPFAKQVYAIRRLGRLTFQTGIDGYRSVAAREAARLDGVFAGSDLPAFGPWVEPKGNAEWGHPEWAEVTVKRRLHDGTILTQTARAWWDEYVPKESTQQFRWRQAPRAQLAKCAEALALRMLFPSVLGDLYVTEELDRSAADEVAAAEAARIAALPSTSDRVSERRASIEARRQAPAAAAQASDRRSRRGSSGGDGPPGDNPPPPNPPDRPAVASGVVTAPEVSATAASVSAPRAVAGEVLGAPVAAAPMRECGAKSPYGDDATCGLAKGHSGNHKSRDRQTWSA